MPSDDEHLAGHATKGDRRAFEAIYRRYHQDLYRYCLAIVANGADAEDALQNTMVKVLGALPGEKRRIRLKPWLYRIAHNESVELLRRRHPSEPLDPELAVAGIAEPAQAVELRDRLRRLVGDLGELPERQRGAIVMRELADLDFAEIGAAFGTSPEVARQTVYEARLSLRQIETGREMSCATVTKALSDADGRTLRRREIKAHLRSCRECQAFRDEIDRRRGELAAIAPLPALAASGLLQGLLGGQAASTGGGLAGMLGGGAGKAVGASALAKTTAAVAAIAAIGIAAGDRAGVIHLSSPSPPGATKTAGQRGGESSPAQATESAVMPKASFSHHQAMRRLHQQALQAARVAGKGQAEQAGEGESAQQAPQGGTHPHGRGHAKELPAAAGHGEETAAIKRGHGGGASGVKGKGHAATRKPHAKGPHPIPPSREHEAGHEPRRQVESRAPQPDEPATSAPGAQAETKGSGKGQ